MLIWNRISPREGRYAFRRREDEFPVAPVLPAGRHATVDISVRATRAFLIRIPGEAPILSRRYTPNFHSGTFSAFAKISGHVRPGRRLGSGATGTEYSGLAARTHASIGLVAPRRVLGTGLLGHTGQNSGRCPTGLRPFGMGILIGSQPVQGDGGRPGLLRRAELLAGERLVILAEVPGGELAE